MGNNSAGWINCSRVIKISRGDIFFPYRRGISIFSLCKPIPIRVFVPRERSLSLVSRAVDIDLRAPRGFDRPRTSESRARFPTADNGRWENARVRPLVWKS